MCLRPLTRKEYLASLLATNARYFFEYKKDLKKAIEYLELALRYDPTFSTAHWNLSRHYATYADQLEEKQITQEASASFLPPGCTDPMLRQLEQQNQARIWQSCQISIQEARSRAEYHRQKAQELGIALGVPRGFAKKQAESIRKFKQTGEY